MKQRLLSLIGIVLVLFLAPGNGSGQTITLTPDAIPNGIASLSGEQYHQRMDIQLGGTASAVINAFTITLPAEVTYVATSGTAAHNAAGAGVRLQAVLGQNLTFDISGVAASQTHTVEFDVTTPASFTGIPTGTKVDTFYVVDFNDDVGSAQDVAVAKHQNLRVESVSFSAPDSTQGDTTSAGGCFYKLAFPSTLPDYSHTFTSGLSAADLAGLVPIFADAATDIQYTFYLSTDSSLIERPLTLAPASHFTLLADPTSGPLAGSRQNPRFIPATFIREDFTTAFATNASDSVNGVISLAGTTDDTVYFVYALADPATGRNPTLNVGSGGDGTGVGKKAFDPTTFGAFSGGVFLGRSGPLLVQHPPEFVIAGWDYDDDTNDDYATTGVIQVPSDINGMGVTAGNTKDNRNITVDSGQFEPKGTTTLTTLAGGLVPKSINTFSMLFVAEDADNPNNFQMNIILSTNSGLTVNELSGGGIDSFDVASSIRVAGTDTLTTNHRVFSFDPIVRDSATNLITSFIAEATYSVYFVATDGTNRTVYQVSDDPFAASPTFSTVTVAHSPNIGQLDSYSVNDFGGDGDLDVNTGIDLSQMFSTAAFAGGDDDGKNLSGGPSQRFVNIHWGGGGLDNDIDVDDDATVEFYYSTRADFNGAGKSFEFTSGNSDGSDLLAAIVQGNNDTHLIGSVSENPDGKFDDNFQWDLWTYVSPENTIPRTGVKYFLYSIMTGGTTRRLVSFTEDGSTVAPGTTPVGVNFEHSPYARVIEPSQDITVSVDEPVNVIWEAVDVDNAAASGLSAVPAGTSGRSSPNSRADSPNLRIILTSTDFGEVTNWATLNAATAPVYFLGNSSAGGFSGEIELNEGVDTAFVIQGNRMRNGVLANATVGTDMGTNNGLGTTYFVYLAVDSGLDGTSAAQGQFFSGRSPAVRAPGRVTFTGVVPTSASTSAKFVIPTRMTAVSEELIRYPIVPDEGDGTGGTTIEVVNIFLTVDASLFDAVDQDASTAGIQPFTLGTNGALSAADVDQAAYIDINTGDLRLDFIYDVGLAGTGLSFFDGEQVLASANLRAKSISGGPRRRRRSRWTTAGHASPR